MKQLRIYFLFILSLLATISSTIISQDKKSTVKGYVLDATTKEKLSYVSIFDSTTFKGTSTSKRGYFSFALSSGAHLLRVSLLGYKPVTKKIFVKHNETIEIIFNLTPLPIEIEAVTIQGEKIKKNIRERTYDLSVADLREIPQVFEPDPIRVVQALPGVTAANDFSGALYLRGGNFDETMIAIDNVPLYNPNHLGGMFSSVNSDIIANEELYLSNYPQKFGGFLSGILNIQTKKFSNKFSAVASVGISSAKITVKTPLFKGSLLASYRRTYLDLVNLFLKDEGFPYSFNDLFLKYSYPLNKKNLIEVTGFYSQDKYILFTRGDYDYLDADPYPSWGNKLIKASFLHLFNKNISLNFNCFVSNAYMNSNFLMKRYGQTEYANVVNSITDITAKINAEITFTGNSLMLGAEVKNLFLKYFWDINSNELYDLIYPVQDVFFDYAPNPYRYESSENIISFFILDQLLISKLFSIQVGFRSTYLRHLNKNYLLPSFKISFSLSEKIEIAFGYGRYIQYLNSFKERKSENLFAPFTTFFLPQKESQLSKSNHFILGVYAENLFLNSKLSVELYYKLRQNLTASYNYTPIYRNEDGYAYGMDILFKKNIGKITGWIGYSLILSIKEGEYYNYFTVYDRTNNFKILIGYQFFKKWRINAFWTYATGTPYTPITGKFISANDYSNDRDPNIFIYNPSLNWRGLEGTKNSMRLSDSHRLDIGITGSFIWGGFIVKPYLQILNVYNSSNPYFIDNKSFYDSNVKNKEIRGSTIIPTIGVTFEY
ncbi:MAG: TonB-dependent receptor [Chlorobi bacterium]|nr:TonB-dependent receptor [Chlorobiota bacterium]